MPNSRLLERCSGFPERATRPLRFAEFFTTLVNPQCALGRLRRACRRHGGGYEIVGNLRGKTAASADPATSAPLAATTNSTASDAAPAPTQPPAPANSTPADVPREWAPMPAESGNPGMFTVETGETLPRDRKS